MAVPRPILIDDADSRIAYTGQWFQDIGSQDSLGTHGPTLNHTLHGTSTDGSLSFSFSGTAVQILGTMIPSQYSNNTGPTWDCYVDNVKVNSNPAATEDRNHYIYCEYDTLTSGEHQLSLNVTTHGQTFWFDFIQFNPINADSYDNAVVLIDNLDPSVKYGSGWHAFPDTTGSNLTNTHGSTIQLDFIGTSIQWVSWDTSTQPHTPSTASYSMDGGAPVTFSLPGLPANTNDDLFNVHSFTVSQLSPGPHSVVVTYLGNQTVTPLVLDYFLITNTTALTNTTNGPTPTPTPTPKPNGTSKVPMGAVIGGAVGGGVVLLLALIGLIFCLRRKKPKRVDRRISIMSARSTLHTTPFTDTRDSRGISMVESQAAFGPESLYNLSGPRGSFSQGESSVPLTTPPHSPFLVKNHNNNSSQPSFTESTAMSAGSSSRVGRKAHLRPPNTQAEPIIAQHRDSGIRTHDQQPVIEVPPEYTES